MAGPGLHLLHAWLRSRSRIERHAPWLLTKPRGWDHFAYSRKLRWRCLHPDPTVDYSVWADKARARELFQGRIPVPELYGVVRNPREIDPATLPRTYIMKATHGWDMSLLVVDGVVVGRNRSDEGAGRPAETTYLRQVAREWLESEEELRRQVRERHYLLVRPGILFEEFLGPIDHELQMFLFDGQFRIGMVFYRGFRHEGTTHRLYDEHWNLMEPGHASVAPTYELLAPPTPRPPQALFDDLGELCRDIDHVRVDLYARDGTYTFGEFTFTHAAGRAGNIGSYDAELGRNWSR